MSNKHIHQLVLIGDVLPVVKIRVQPCNVDRRSMQKADCYKYRRYQLSITSVLSIFRYNT